MTVRWTRWLALTPFRRSAPALIFPDFKVVGLNASTNNPGMDNPAGATLIVGAEIQRITGGAAASLTISVTDEDYALPAGSKLLTSGATGLFTNVPAGDTQKFTSWFNPSNTALAKEPPPAGPITFVSAGGGVQNFSTVTPGIPVGSAGTYGLTNETVITMGGGARRIDSRHGYRRHDASSRHGDSRTGESRYHAAGFAGGDHGLVPTPQGPCNVRELICSHDRR